VGQCPSAEVGCYYVEKAHPAAIPQICGDGPHGLANTPGRYE